MKTDCIPTIKSLIDQKAINVCGDTALIKKFSEYIYSKGFHFEEPEIIDLTEYNQFGISRVMPPWVNISESLFEECPTNSNSEEVLYSLKFQPEAINLNAHIQTSSGVVIKNIYTKSNPNLKQLSATFNTLYRRLDQSTLFFICHRCNQLVASEFRDDSSMAVCADNSCKDTFKQKFDTSSVDRISSSKNDNIRVYKDKDGIKFLSYITLWPHPHHSVSGYKLKAILPLSATHEQARIVQRELEAKHKYPARCYHCQRTCHQGEDLSLNNLTDRETDDIVCHNCASIHYGVMY